MRRQQDQQSRVFYELSALVLNLLRSPPSPAPFSEHSPEVYTRRPTTTQISPAGFASLLLGISLALMLCGSVTFFIGFILMPWVLGLVMVFYFVGIVSNLSVLGRAIICQATAPAKPRKEIPGKGLDDHPRVVLPRPFFFFKYNLVINLVLYCFLLCLFLEKSYLRFLDMMPGVNSFNESLKQFIQVFSAMKS